MTEFDTYWKWLGIPPEEQPPDHYQLLGIQRFEADADVIENAAVRQMAHVRTFQGGEHAELSQQLLNELSTARICLLNVAQKQAYDSQLKLQLPADTPVQDDVPMATPVPTPSGVPVAQPVSALGPLPGNRPRRRSRRRRQQRSARESQLAWTLILVSIITLLIAVALGVYLFRKGESSDEVTQASVPLHSIDNVSPPWQPNEF